MGSAERAFQLRVVHTLDNLFMTSVWTTIDTCVLTRSRLLCLFPESVLRCWEVQSLRCRIPPSTWETCRQMESQGYKISSPSSSTLEWKAVRRIGDSHTFQWIHSLVDSKDKLATHALVALSEEMEVANVSEHLCRFANGYPFRRMDFFEQSFNYGLKVGSPA